MGFDDKCFICGEILVKSSLEPHLDSEKELMVSGIWVSVITVG